MSFRDNLQHLRATRNMTQEQLAMLMGVSRQSVTKWEAEKAYPEMDKLLKLRDIFGCTLDELVQGDLTTRPKEPGLGIAEGPAQDVCGYDEHMRQHARNMAVGIPLIILGMAGAAFFGELGHNMLPIDNDALSGLVFLALTLVGLCFIIPAGLRHDAFAKAHPYVEDFYTATQREAANRLFPAASLGASWPSSWASCLLSASTTASSGLEAPFSPAWRWASRCSSTRHSCMTASTWTSTTTPLWRTSPMTRFASWVRVTPTRS